MISHLCNYSYVGEWINDDMSEHGIFYEANQLEGVDWKNGVRIKKEKDAQQFNINGKRSNENEGTLRMKMRPTTNENEATCSRYLV